MANDGKKEELTDDEISERGGMRAVTSQKDEEKDLTESEEDTESETEEESEEETEDESSKDSAEESDDESESDDDESKGKEGAKTKVVKKESDQDESEESEDDSEEEDEDAEDDEDQEDDDKSGGRKRTVPYGKLKAERTKVKDLREQIDELNETIAKSRASKNGTDEEDELDEIDKTAEDLAKELGQDSAGLKKVLEAAVKLARKEMGDKDLPKDLKEKLKLLDKFQAEDIQKKETAHFESEWGKLIPALKKRFPNATEAMLVEAKGKMDDLAHSKKFHKYDLDYILYKKPKTFGTILTAAAGNKSGEGGKQIGTGVDESAEEGETLVNIEDMTPQIMRSRDQKSVARKGSSKNDDPGLQIFEPLES